MLIHRRSLHQVIMPYLTPELELVEDLDDTERGDNGFGSTGV